jgi:hypothetical protein
MDLDCAVESENKVILLNRLMLTESFNKTRHITLERGALDNDVDSLFGTRLGKDFRDVICMVKFGLEIKCAHKNRLVLVGNGERV